MLKQQLIAVVLEKKYIKPGFDIFTPKNSSSIKRQLNLSSSGKVKENRSSKIFTFLGLFSIIF